MRPLEPAVRNRLLAAERRRIPGEPHGHPRRAQAIVALAIEAIRAFADVEDDVGQIEPPGGEPQTFERLGILLVCSDASNARRAACQSPRSSAARPASRPSDGSIGVTRSRRGAWVFTVGLAQMARTSVPSGFFNSGKPPLDPGTASAPAQPPLFVFRVFCLLVPGSTEGRALNGDNSRTRHCLDDALIDSGATLNDAPANRRPETATRASAGTID